MNKNKPELLAPAGDWKSLITAINNGADAVYFGVEKLNMRAAADNFKIDELTEIVDYCHRHNVDAHLTLNTIVYQNEIADLEEIVKSASLAKIDMIICWDFSVINMCKKYNVPFCISTQASISNASAVEFYRNLGAKRVVLARECTLEQIIDIKKTTGFEIETFIHGAMCVAVSGRCFMSHLAFNKSANRGECLQPCRREYEIKDTDSDTSFIIGNDYVMSPKDLWSIDFIELLIESGIDSFKIEGRKRSPEYNAKVVSSYRKAIDAYFEGKLTDEFKNNLKDELKTVYNRGFSTGFYFGRPDAEDFTDIYGSKATTRKLFIGRVKNYFKKSNIVHVYINSNDISPGDHLYISGNTTGLVEVDVKNLIMNEKEIVKGNKGDDVTFYCEPVVRVNDEVYKVIKIEEYKNMVNKQTAQGDF